MPKPGCFFSQPVGLALGSLFGWVGWWWDPQQGPPAGFSQPGIQVPFFFPDCELIQKRCAPACASPGQSAGVGAAHAEGDPRVTQRTWGTVKSRCTCGSSGGTKAPPSHQLSDGCDRSAQGQDRRSRTWSCSAASEVNEFIIPPGYHIHLR